MVVVLLCFFLRLDLLQNFAPGFGGLAGRVFCFQTKIGKQFTPPGQRQLKLKCVRSFAGIFFWGIYSTCMYMFFLNKTSILERTFQKNNNNNNNNNNIWKRTSYITCMGINIFGKLMLVESWSNGAIFMSIYGSDSSFSHMLQLFTVSFDGLSPEDKRHVPTLWIILNHTDKLGRSTSLSETPHTSILLYLTKNYLV